MPGKQYTVKDVAEILQCERRTVCNLCIRGEIKAYKLGSSWRIPSENLELFIKEKQETRGGGRR